MNIETGIIFIFGLALGILTHAGWELFSTWRELQQEAREQRRQRRDEAEVYRILHDITPDLNNPLPVIRMSPLVSWDDLFEPSATGWERASVPYAPDVDLPRSRRGLRQWWADWNESTKPRTAEQVALQAYEAAVMANGPTYRGRHSGDGYTEQQRGHLNTHTAEYPSLRHLRTTWRHVDSPVPAEVLV